LRVTVVKSHAASRIFSKRAPVSALPRQAYVRRMQ
jgi:hypothetical protein